MSRFRILLLAMLSCILPVAVLTMPAKADAVGSGGTFVPLVYTRLFDTVSSSTPFTAGEQRTYQVLGRAGIPTTNVGAVVLDVAVSRTTATGSTSVAVWTGGTSAPAVPNLRIDAGSAPRSNTVVVAPGADGKISISNSAGLTDMNVDVQGYFTSADAESGAAPGGYVPVAPYRALTFAEIPAGSTREVQVGGLGGIDADASAVFLNIAVRNAVSDGTLVIVPKGTSVSGAKPLVNYSIGAPNDMGAPVRLAGGGLRVHNPSAQAITVALTVQGFFAADPMQGGGFEATSPTQVFNAVLPAGASRNVRLGGVAGAPSVGLGGVVLNILARSSTGTGYGNLSVYSAGPVDPNISVLGWKAGSDTPANTTTTIVRPGIDASITLKNMSDTTDAVIQVVVGGWFHAQTDPTVSQIMAHLGASEADVVASLDEMVAESMTDPEVAPVTFDQAKELMLRDLMQPPAEGSTTATQSEAVPQPAATCEWAVQPRDQQITVVHQGEVAQLAEATDGSNSTRPVYTGVVNGDTVTVTVWQGTSDAEIDSLLSAAESESNALKEASLAGAVEGDAEVETTATFAGVEDSSSLDTVSYRLEAAGVVEYGVPDEVAPASAGTQIEGESSTGATSDEAEPPSECLRTTASADSGAELSTDSGTITMSAASASGSPDGTSAAETYPSTSSAIRYRTFIPGATASTGYVCGKFRGDDRDFTNYYRAGSRTRASVFFNWPDQTIDTTKAVGATHRYKGYFRSAKTKTASSKGIKFRDATMSSKYGRIVISHSVGNPLCRFAGAIKYNVVVEAWEDGSARISGTRVEVPAHEVIFYPKTESTGRTLFRGEANKFICLNLNCGSETIRESVS